MSTKRFRRSPIALAVALLLVTTAVTFGQTQETPSIGGEAEQARPEPEGFSGRVGYGALAVVENVGYIPAKLGYTLLGAVIGAGTYAVTLGNKKEAKRIWRQAFGGNYVLTPSMVAGKTPINFSGTEESPETASSAPEATPTGSPSPEATQSAPVATPKPVARRPSKKKKPRPWWHIW